MNSLMRADPSSQQEAKLLEHVERLGRHRIGRKAIHLHLSKLRSHNRRDYHLRIAANTFENLVSIYEGQLFKLSNQDVVFVFRDASPVQVDEAIMRLGYLFNDDPIGGDVDPDTMAKFCTWYDVEREYDQFLAMVMLLNEEAQKRSRRVAALTPMAMEDKPAVNPHHLGALIDTIQAADLSNLMRRQMVYALLSNQAPQPLFNELFISINDLQKLILPDYNINSNRWLFQYLTETLDKRMLALLARNDDPAIANSFSLNLNIATLLSPEFLAFDASLKSGARGTIVLEIQVIDVYADIEQFAFARDFAHDRGYRICIDLLTAHNFPFVDRAKLGVDLVKLDWSRIMAGQQSTDRQARLRTLIDETGKAKVILCHVDTEDGHKFGQAIGVAMYQGRYIDQIAAPRYSGIRPR
jgi:EAL domain-containing protein (putative c-di-GMP-specific phosphodiesterase class I)